MSVGGIYGVRESVAVNISVAVKVGMAVHVEVGVPVTINGVKLKVGDGGVSVRLGVVVSEAVAVGVVGAGLIINATHPRQ